MAHIPDVELFIDDTMFLVNEHDDYDIKASTKSNSIIIISYKPNRNIKQAIEETIIHFQQIIVDYKVQPIFLIDFCDDGIILNWFIRLE